MTLRNLVVILLRLFSLNLFVSAILAAVEAITRFAALPAARASIWSYLFAVPYLVLAFVVWVLAAPLARLVTREHNSPVSISGLARVDLYAFGFLLVGLYFVVSSIAPTINWLHYYARLYGGAYAQLDPPKSFYDLSQPILTLLAGLFVFLPADRWARKMIEYEPQRNGA